MTTGTANVNDLSAVYQLTTLIPLFFFARYDHRHHLIRNAALLAFLPWCLLSLPVSLSGGCPAAERICESLTGFLAGGSLLFIICMATNGGVGGGDIKLVALLGIILGMPGILTLLLLSCLLALLQIAFQDLMYGSHSSRIPFAPSLFTGYLVLVLFSLSA